jgi:DNA modification methylase
MALIKSAIGVCSAPLLYVFTDWRVWVNLFDTVESAGFAVRSMIVWHKDYAAMGVGWRAQHELVLFGSRTPVKFDIDKGIGNVIESKRTGNPLRPTQKPIDLLASILTVTHMAATIYDPFAGSGSTMIAAEQVGRAAFSIEMMPAFCDVAVKRWSKFTGRAAVLADDGRSFDEVSAARKAA